jgi:hypothetical protein
MSLARRSGEMVLSIRDNGRGLPPAMDTPEGPSGMGMIGMRARARSTGGDVNVKSTAGQGVEIEVRAPAMTAKDESKDPHPVG